LMVGYPRSEGSRAHSPYDKIAGKLGPYDQPEEAQEFYVLKRAPTGGNTVPVERYIKARKQIRRMPRYSTALGTRLPSAGARPGGDLEAQALGSWSQLGPGNIGGRTRALAINPSNPNMMYAGAVAGGVWRTTDAGASWAPIGDLLPNLSVSSIA